MKWTKLQTGLRCGFPTGALSRNVPARTDEISSRWPARARPEFEKWKTSRFDGPPRLRIDFVSPDLSYVIKPRARTMNQVADRSNSFQFRIRISLPPSCPREEISRRNSNECDVSPKACNLMASLINIHYNNKYCQVNEGVVRSIFRKKATVSFQQWTSFVHIKKIQIVRAYVVLYYYKFKEVF